MAAAHRELPDWKRLGGNGLAEVLSRGDFVQEPIRAAGIRHILRALGVEHALHKTVPVPVLAAGELAQVGFR
jgi:hypothetical protein